MQTLSPEFLAAIAADATRPLMLVEIGFSVPLRLATYDTLTWNGTAWLADRDVRVVLRNNAATVTIGNHDELMSAYLLNERIGGRPVNLWEAWLDGGSMHLRQVLSGIGGRARCGLDAAVIEVSAGNALAHAPRRLVRHAVGWPPPKPDGFTVRWDDTDYVIRGRQ